MSVWKRQELKQHETHKVVCVIYASGVNAAIECVSCSEVIVDYNNDEKHGEKYDQLAEHAGHALEVVDYSDVTAVECLACGDALHEAKRK